MFKYEIINHPKFKIDENIVKKIFFQINKTIKIKQNWTLNIIFVSPKEIQNLNKNYRKKNNITDVLSFHYFDNFLDLKSKNIAWELVFCEEKIILQWLKYWLWKEKEFYKLLIHSILHILWFNHEKENDYKIMQEFENKIWQEIFGKNN